MKPLPSLALVVFLVAVAVGQEIPLTEYVTTAHQAGPVGYRDTLGAISPDGQWLATAVNRHLYIERVRGGVRRELMPDTRLKSWLAWLPDSRQLAVEEPNPQGGPSDWFVYDMRRTLWSAGQTLSGALPDQSGRLQIAANRLTQLAWAPHGKAVAGIAPGAVGSSNLWVTKTQIFTAQIAAMAAAGGPASVLTEFQAETPIWDPTGQQISMTYGTWRRVADDAKYPDIAQELGLRWIAHISQDSRGTFQLFRVPVDGGQSEQLSHDLSNKTHPAYSPDGRHLAFTVWTYDAQFWMIRP